MYQAFTTTQELQNSTLFLPEIFIFYLYSQVLFWTSCNFVGGLKKGGNLPPIQFAKTKQIRLKQDTSVLSAVHGNTYLSCSPLPPAPYHQNKQYGLTPELCFQLCHVQIQKNLKHSKNIIIQFFFFWIFSSFFPQFCPLPPQAGWLNYSPQITAS